LAGIDALSADDRIELDTNPVERAIRPVALDRKNQLFAVRDSGGERWALSERWSKPSNSTALSPTSI
jgi:Transposase IS66 family